MSLSPGTRLGVYVVSTQIGEGGMGAVYRATDTSLDRQVAIKVLPDAFAQDVERLVRFEREAKTLAALNHPNIAQIHGFEGAAGTPALVMELVDGPTLQDLIGRAGDRAPGGREARQAVGLPLDEVLPIARQIAGALEAAHEQGIIHRDLKPANVKVRADGMVKVLDFGLAKALDATASGAAAGTFSMSPTFTTPAMTQMGTIVGTAAYMSPEQARGKPVDRRADIWAFGVVLYEMLTGRPVFGGETVTDVLALVLTKEPDLSAIPGTWRRLIAGCLEKDPRKRVRDIADVWLLLESDGIPRSAASSPRRAWPWALAAFAAGAAVTWITLGASRTPATEAPLAFVEPPPPGTQFIAAPLVSPDGRRLALIAADEAGKARLWTRDLGDAVPHVVDGTDGAAMAFWSPDSQQLAFVAQGQVRRIAAGGGAVSLVAVANPRSGVWLPDGDLLLAVTGQGLLRVPSSGGSLRPANGLTSEALQGLQIDGLDVSPDGRLVLFSQFGGETGVYIARVDGTSKRLLYPGQQSSAVFVGSDLIVRREANVLMAQRFRSADVRLVGEAFPIAEDASDFELAGGASGSLSFITGARQISHLSWFTRDGAAAGTAGPDGEYTEVGISRGGRWLGFVRRDSADGNVDVWIQALPGGAPSRLTSDPDIDHLFTISRDEREVAWEAHAKGALTLMRRPIDGSSPVQSVRPWGKAGGPSDWSPDGRFVLYQSDDGPAGDNLWNVPIAGSGDPVRLTVPGAQVQTGQFSPDGRWLAFSGLATGNAEVYVQRVDGMKLAGGPIRVSDSGGDWPLWRRDGAELFFLNRGALMAVEFHSQSDRPAGTPRVLFTTVLSGSGSLGYGRKYAVTPDGRRILAIVPAATQTTHAATVMLNWRGGISER